MTALPVGLLVQLAAEFVRGPVAKLLESRVADAKARQELAAELEREATAYFAKSQSLGADVVMAEVRSEHWLTRSWRPLLMLMLMGFLLFVGFILPFAELAAGARLAFEPRWQLLPPGFWDFLAVGMGGYIGGRSLEKVTGLIAGSAPRGKKD